MPKLTIEEIAEVRNALQIIQGNAERTGNIVCVGGVAKSSMEIITLQVSRIDKLLPKIRYEKNLCLKAATRGEKRNGRQCGMRGF